MTPALGCEKPSVNEKPSATSLEDPVEEFEWGMRRLKRALRLFRPSAAEGLATKRNVEYELIPPEGKQSNYTARVTVTSATSYLHGKRIKLDKKSATAEKSKAKDPNADAIDPVT